MLTMSEIMALAAQEKVSDIHISINLPPSGRVHGELKPLVDGWILNKADTERLAKSIMHHSHVVEFEEKGEVDFAHTEPGVGRFRLNVFTQKGTYAMTARLLNSTIPAPATLGIPEPVVKLIEKRRGLVLVTGPTGSGKSTTLASLINQINVSESRHIITLEDPIEYVHEHKKSIVNQRELGIDTLSFPNALRAALRQDPDVILVGEMRDLDTISIAVTAAETGHLVFSTLHTVGAANTIDRVIDVFPPHQQQQIRAQLADVLECVVSQQLLPTADGKGRVAAFEVMLATPAIKNLIREGKTFQIPSMILTNSKMGMKTMDDYLYDLYDMGYITSETALSFSQDRAALSKRVF